MNLVFLEHVNDVKTADKGGAGTPAPPTGDTATFIATSKLFLAYLGQMSLLLKYTQNGPLIGFSPVSYLRHWRMVTSSALAQTAWVNPYFNRSFLTSSGLGFFMFDTAFVNNSFVVLLIILSCFNRCCFQTTRGNCNRPVGCMNYSVL